MMAKVYFDLIIKMIFDKSEFKVKYLSLDPFTCE